jgi:hypothetical protein
MPERRTFDFQNNKFESMNLDILKRTHLEDAPDGSPLRGIYHYQAIERTMEICGKYGLDHHIEEIFAAQNNSKHLPGVAILKKEEIVHGDKAIEAHILRRIFTTIRIDNDQTEELTTTIVMTYHQDGMQAAIGPCVKICHNQCILSPERTVSTYGKNKVGLDEFFATIDGWLSAFEVQMTADRERILRMKNTPVGEMELFAYIGMLTAVRVAHDSAHEELSSRIPGDYPLNQSQISAFTEDALLKFGAHRSLTAWDLYNIATEYYKPEKTTIPSLVSQNVAFAASLEQFFGMNRPQAVQNPQRLPA